MGVYIKGMEMPKTAFECSKKVNPDERQCYFTGKVFEEKLGLLIGHRCSDCPLVEVKEPHGDLIDRDALGIGEYEREDDDTGTLEISLGGLLEVYHKVKEAPAIIAREDGKIGVKRT